MLPTIGTSGAIKTITSMVLISIHPFALRRLILVVLALVGFSALCYADPVLMARRYGTEKAPPTRPDAPALAHVAPVASGLVPLQSLAIVSPIFAGEARATLHKPALPLPSLTSLISQNRDCDLRIISFPDIVSDPLLTISTNTD